MRGLLQRLWARVREASGDDASERYLAQWRAHHGDSGATALGRAAFYRDEQRRKWEGVRRCC